VNTSKYDIYRFADKDRVGTALDAANRTKADGGGDYWGDTVILASSQVYADALAATPLADVEDAPILLNQEGSKLDPRVANYIDGGADHQTVDNVILAGGTSVFSNDIK